MKLTIDIPAVEFHKRVDSEGEVLYFMIHEPMENGKFSVLKCRVISVDSRLTFPEE